MFQRITVLALALAAAAVTFAPDRAEAAKERCKVYVRGDYQLVGRTYTDGGCAMKAREIVGPVACADGSKKFEYKYMFDGKISRREGYCSNVR